LSNYTIFVFLNMIIRNSFLISIFDPFVSSSSILGLVILDKGKTLLLENAGKDTVSFISIS
jgi:hypothetical protein